MKSGGGLYWNDVEPYFTNINNMRFSNNKAFIYGNDVGSIPAKIVYINQN
jgi:hypothetical protein